MTPEAEERESRFMVWAREEIRRSGASESIYGPDLARAVTALAELFDSQNHSGGSAAIVGQLVTRLMRWEPLSPLTGEDDEWTEVSDGVYQNRRCSRVFKEGGRTYDIEGRIFREPSGACFTSVASHTDVTFPYVPTSLYVDVEPEQVRS